MRVKKSISSIHIWKAINWKQQWHLSRSANQLQAIMFAANMFTGTFSYIFTCTWSPLLLWISHTLHSFVHLVVFYFVSDAQFYRCISWNGFKYFGLRNLEFMINFDEKEWIFHLSDRIWEKISSFFILSEMWKLDACFN